MQAGAEGGGGEGERTSPINSPFDSKQHRSTLQNEGPKSPPQTAGPYITLHILQYITLHTEERGQGGKRANEM